MNRTLTLATVILIGLAAALAFSLTFLTPGSADPSSDSLAAQHNVLPANSGAQNKKREYPSDLLASARADIPEQLPASLKGTDVPS